MAIFDNESLGIVKIEEGQDQHSSRSNVIGYALKISLLKRYINILKEEKLILNGNTESVNPLDEFLALLGVNKSDKTATTKVDKKPMVSKRIMDDCMESLIGEANQEFKEAIEGLIDAIKNLPKDLKESPLLEVKNILTPLQEIPSSDYKHLLTDDRSPDYIANNHNKVIVDLCLEDDFLKDGASNQDIQEMDSPNLGSATRSNVMRHIRYIIKNNLSYCSNVVYSLLKDAEKKFKDPEKRYCKDSGSTHAKVEEIYQKSKKQLNDSARPLNDKQNPVQLAKMHKKIKSVVINECKKAISETSCAKAIIYHCYPLVVDHFSLSRIAQSTEFQNMDFSYVDSDFKFGNIDSAFIRKIVEKTFRSKKFQDHMKSKSPAIEKTSFVNTKMKPPYNLDDITMIRQTFVPLYSMKPPYNLDDIMMIRQMFVPLYSHIDNYIEDIKTKNESMELLKPEAIVLIKEFLFKLYIQKKFRDKNNQLNLAVLLSVCNNISDDLMPLLKDYVSEPLEALEKLEKIEENTKQTNQEKASPNQEEAPKGLGDTSASPSSKEHSSSRVMNQK